MNQLPLLLYCDYRGSIWSIAAVLDDGTVKLKQVLTDGSMKSTMLSSNFDVFLKKYTPTAETHALMDGWPERSMETSIDFATCGVKAAIQCALSSIIVKKPLPDVVCKKSPCRGVFAKDKYKKGQFVMVPLTMRIGSDVADNPVPNHCLQVYCDAVPISPGYAFFLMPPQGKDLVSPAWLVRSSHNKDEATAAWVLFPEHIIAAKDGTNKIKRPDPTLNVKMHIPVLVNTKELQCGDELVLYVDPPEKKEIPKSDPKKKALELTLPEPCPKHVRLI